jgi:hypothetical protein
MTTEIKELEELFKKLEKLNFYKITKMFNKRIRLYKINIWTNENTFIEFSRFRASLYSIKFEYKFDFDDKEEVKDAYIYFHNDLNNAFELIKLLKGCKGNEKPKEKK